MQQSTEIDQLATALAAFQKDVSVVKKDATNPHFKSSFASLASVMKTALPELTKHGLSLSQDPDFDGEHDLLTTTLMHSSGQWKSATMCLHLPKDDPQGQGSALTYAKRYAAMGALGLVAEEDDDGETAVKAYQSRGPARSYKPSPPRGDIVNTPPERQANPQNGEARSGPMTAEQIAEMRLQAQGLLEKSTVEP